MPENIFISDVISLLLWAIRILDRAIVRTSSKPVPHGLNSTTFASYLLSVVCDKSAGGFGFACTVLINQADSAVMRNKTQWTFVVIFFLYQVQVLVIIKQYHLIFWLIVMKTFQNIQLISIVFVIKSKIYCGCDFDRFIWLSLLGFFFHFELKCLCKHTNVQKTL